jgi:CheY-specific phosphatase CheX
MGAAVSTVQLQAPVHIQAILTATSQTLGMLFGDEPRLGSPALRPAAQSTGQAELCVIVGFTGAVQGQLLLGLSRQLAAELAGALLGSTPAFDELAMSGMAEIGNMVAGACATELHGHGFATNITVPTVIAGQHVQVSWPNMYVLETRVDMRLGTLSLAIGLKVGRAAG